jgi:hypothetical protein
VTENDKLPLQVCDVCMMHLDICHKLVQCCADTDKNLNLMISKEDLEISMRAPETGLECLNHPELVTSITKGSATNTPKNTLTKVNSDRFKTNMIYNQINCFRLLISASKFWSLN